MRNINGEFTREAEDSEGKYITDLNFEFVVCYLCHD